MCVRRLQVGNFRVEPPSLFRGRGEHPKMGKIKQRVYPRDITINIGRDAPIPEHPYPGQRWKEVRGHICLGGMGEGGLAGHQWLAGRAACAGGEVVVRRLCVQPKLKVMCCSVLPASDG